MDVLVEAAELVTPSLLGESGQHSAGDRAVIYRRTRFAACTHTRQKQFRTKRCTIHINILCAAEPRLTFMYAYCLQLSVHARPIYGCLAMCFGMVKSFPSRLFRRWGRTGLARIAWWCFVDACLYVSVLCCALWCL